ncbi:MAG: alkyl hydroperoxide reductase subunit F [Candidatus Sericytochromatia bacterium]|nr:alkyl hydroperoxide reductase subunit F [Candidatus Sericytochromatia bacterium]
MLDAALLDQLRPLLAELPFPLTLVVRPSSHERQQDMVMLARQLAGVTPAIDTRIEGAEAVVPTLDILRNDTPTGLTFRGVPGGHEFTSLVLALLLVSGKGRLPDARTAARISQLRATAPLRTYVSLDCTNCPDVVQALNTLATLHPHLTHEMVDGALVPDEVARLGIKGVPAVFAGERLIHSGRATFLDLLSTLEQHLGTDAIAEPEDVAERYDVVVIGGGPAGASAAIYTARKGLRTALVAERFGGQVRETMGIENLIGTPRTEGKRLAADLEAHVRNYDITLLEHRRVASLTRGEHKEILLEGGERLQAGSVIVATGAKWRELEVPGEKEYLGRGVAFCPHCDGPFYKDRRVAVVGGGNSGVEAALDLSGIVRHVTVMEFSDSLRADAVLLSKLQAKGNVTILNGVRTTAILGDGEKVTGLAYEDRATGDKRSLELDGVFVQIGLVPNSSFLGDLVERNPRGEILVDDKGRTSEPGIYAAGDVTTVPFKQIVIAMGEGARVALTTYEDLALGA